MKSLESNDLCGFLQARISYGKNHIFKWGIFRVFPRLDHTRRPLYFQINTEAFAARFQPQKHLISHKTLELIRNAIQYRQIRLRSTNFPNLATHQTIPIGKTHSQSHTKYIKITKILTNTTKLQIT